MMKLSTRARYGVRAICALAIMSKDGEPVPLARISEQEDISKDYLALIFHRLRQSGLVEAERGIHGGFKLAKDPKDITVASVIHALEGSITPVDCLGPPGRSAASRCKRKQHCLSRPAWLRLQLQIEQALDSITIASLVNAKDQDGYPDMVGGTQCAK